MPITSRNIQKGRFSRGESRALCYAAGALSGAFFLNFRHHAGDWSIRFHAVHSMLLTAVWAFAWSALRLIESISPWFLSVLVREIRFAVDLGFVVVWAALLITAYRGSRLALIPFIHSFAVRLGRRYERREVA